MPFISFYSRYPDTGDLVTLLLPPVPPVLVLAVGLPRVPRVNWRFYATELGTSTWIPALTLAHALHVPE
jgi:hypothetical protein